MPYSAFNNYIFNIKKRTNKKCSELFQMSNRLYLLRDPPGGHLLCHEVVCFDSVSIEQHYNYGRPCASCLNSYQVKAVTQHKIFNFFFNLLTFILLT